MHFQRPVLRALLVLTAASLSLAALGGCAEMMKAMGDATATLMTEKTQSIRNASLQASYTTNLFPRETQETGIQYFGEAWQEGKNALSLMFFKNKGVGFYALDGGSIGYRNAGTQEPFKPLPYIAYGAYIATLEGNDTAPKEIQIQSPQGENMQFTVTPAPPVKIKSVNGKATGAQVDLSKDLVLELDNPTQGNNSMLRVSLLSTVLGVKTFVDVAIVKPASRVVIPAAAFQHLSVTSSAQGFVALDQGSNFIRVERYQVRGSESLKNRAVAAFQNLGLAWSTVPVTVSGNVRDQSYIQLDGTLPVGKDKPMRYQVYSQNAFYSRPLRSGKNFGVSSLHLEGTLYEKKTTTSESTMGDYKVITTTTVTKQFPQLSDAIWDQVLQSFHSELSALLKKDYGISMTPTEKLIQSPTYAEFEEASEENTYRFIKRSYKNTKYLLARSLGKIIESASSTFASDRPPSRLMKETGTDGLISLNLNLQIATDKDDHLILIPNLNYRIDAPPHGYVVGPTSYVQGWVEGTGTPFTANDLKTGAGISRIIQQKELLAALQKSWKELESRQREAGYHAIWGVK
ncbi:MAG: hypothetical protein ACO1RX_06310 [Candidatus Sericytochromatia bacterium]